MSKGRELALAWPPEPGGKQGEVVEMPGTLPTLRRPAPASGPRQVSRREIPK